MERRARPTERTKTPEEIAQEERQKLEELEVYFSRKALHLSDCSVKVGWLASFNLDTNFLKLLGKP